MNTSLNTPLPANKWTGHLVNPCALVVITIALLVIIGWLFGIEPLKRVMPHLHSMKFNTALYFLLAGMALLWRQHLIVRMAIGLSIAIVGAVTLDEYGQNTGFGIDQILLKTMRQG